MMIRYSLLFGGIIITYYSFYFIHYLVIRYSLFINIVVLVPIRQKL